MPSGWDRLEVVGDAGAEGVDGGDVVAALGEGAIARPCPAFLLPAPERFLETAVDACRSHIQPLFEAIARENPYPARYFPELNFNQMVLKALFTGVALARVIGCDGRVTSELSRMAADYASERRAAGRSVPPDIGMLTAGRLTGDRGDQP